MYKKFKTKMPSKIAIKKSILWNAWLRKSNNNTIDLRRKKQTVSNQKYEIVDVLHIFNWDCLFLVGTKWKNDNKFHHPPLILTYCYFLRLLPFSLSHNKNGFILDLKLYSVFWLCINTATIIGHVYIYTIDFWKYILKRETIGEKEKEI